MRSSSKRLTMESLESREMLAADVGADSLDTVARAAVVASGNEASFLGDEGAKTILALRSLAEMAGASDEVIHQAIRNVTSALYAKERGSEAIAAAEKAIVVDGFGLPAEALKTDLTAGKLLRFSSTLHMLDEDAHEKWLSKPETYREIAKLGGDAGTESILQKSIGTMFDIPEHLWSTLGSKEMLEGVAAAESIDAGSAVSKEGFWQDLAKFNSDQKTSNEFLGDWSGTDSNRTETDAGDTDVSNVQADSLEEPALNSPSTGDETGDWEDFADDPYATVTYTDDGGFDMSGVNGDGDAFSEHFSPNQDGTYSGEFGGTSSSKPPAGTHSLGQDSEGSYIQVTTDDGSDANDDVDNNNADDNDDGNNDSDGDDSDDEDTENDNDAEEESQAETEDDSDENSNAGSKESAGTPTPDSPLAPHDLLGWALQYPDSPLAQEIFRMIDAAAEQAERQGGTVDPASVNGGTQTPNRDWAIGNSKHPAAQSLLEAIDHAFTEVGDAGGTNNNPNAYEPTLWDALASTSHIDFILCGGGLVDPPQEASGGGADAFGGIKPQGGHQHDLDGDGDDPDEPGMYSVQFNVSLFSAAMNFKATTILK